MKRLSTILFYLIFLSFNAAASDSNTKVIYYKIFDEIGPASSRITAKAFNTAKERNASAIILHLNTFGGLLTDADSIKTKILGSKIPVFVFIDNNAASAGALISIACNKIYMVKGASIGAASVVTQGGEIAPDKYQSYMRSTMRATAEARSRNPEIAQAMVDGDFPVEGLTDSGKVLTLTAQEALKWGYCDSILNNWQEILSINNLQNAEIIVVEPDTMDDIMAFLLNPALSGILILLILGGIYYELQSPGLGFPIVVSIIAALLYFAPLYLEGLAQNWEILIFLVGIILVAIELFSIPGFGILGISGIILILSGLTLALIRNINFDFSLTDSGSINSALGTVIISLVGFIAFAIFLGKSLMESKLFKRIVLADTLSDSKSPLIGNEISQKFEIGTLAIAYTDLRPMGKIRIDDDFYSAKALSGFISAGSEIKIVQISSGTIYVEKI